MIYKRKEKKQCQAYTVDNGTPFTSFYYLTVFRSTGHVRRLR
ncbi:MAG: hypothetical protein U9R17_18955 [Thermodesulfobacteriota bacterium]|nr:hypothetical protein [Thermodesulfobacteriota bacterium]